jgi:hypothetical protein
MNPSSQCSQSMKRLEEEEKKERLKEGKKKSFRITLFKKVMLALQKEDTTFRSSASQIFDNTDNVVKIFAKTRRGLNEKNLSIKEIELLGKVSVLAKETQERISRAFAELPVA